MNILPTFIRNLFSFWNNWIILVFISLFSFLVGSSVFANTASHSLILKSDGSLHTFGLNSFGMLGDGSTTTRNSPTQILASGVSQIAGSVFHSMVLKSDGSLHTFGYNSTGQLGDGTTTTRNTPTQILASGVSQIAAGLTHSLILKSDGSLHTFGNNTNGQLGDGTTTQRNIPTQILASGVSQIAAGTSHSLILKSDGSLHSFGLNDNGQLGDGSTTQRNTPTQILASGVSQIAAGDLGHSLILKSDGSLHTFGLNDNGQLGDGTTTQRNTPTQILAFGVAQIAAGGGHSLILKSDGSLHTFGKNNSGQLGDGTTTDKNTPTQILASGVARLSEQPVPYAETFTVSGGLSTAPYYDFNDSQGNTPDMTSFIFHKGSRYLFTANNISGSHPFMIGTSRGVSSPIVNGGPLNSAGNGHQIIVDIPQDFNSTLVYYCTNHTTMSQSMNVASPSGGFFPVYNLNASQLTSLVNSSNIVAGNYKVVEEMNASNQLELRIRPVVQTNGSWVDFGANLFYRTNSSYPTLSSVLNYITSNNINAVNAPTVDTISITSPTSGSTVLENNDNLHVYINYQSNGGGYQTPTWAYRIDSGFPGYGSPHGGTQVTGTSTKSNFLSGQSYGSKTVHVALLDQSGNLHNPPITLNRTLNYQSSGGGYSSPGGGYSSPGSGYSSPGSGYSSSSSGYSSPPIYETTATLLVNNQPTSIAGIPPAGSGSTWYQSFTAENSAKLTKFAFATNGSFSATADVKIREGEGITGNILHSGTWSGLGSNTNNFNEYEITNEVLLTSGQKYTIQLENQTSGGFIGSNPGQYNGGMFYYSGYSGEYGDLKMKIWGLLEATGNAIEIISPAYDDQNITDSNDTLTISYNYQSNAGGYQTPTWAYRIDSGFPGYGSPHGGTQVTGSRINNNFLNGQTYGNKTVYVALLDPAGNLHNPPVTQSISVNYQTPTSGYQSSTGGTIAISSPGNSADVNATNDNLQVTVTYTSPSGGYQTPTWAYRIDSGFPGYGSPHGGTQVTGNQANDFLAGESFGARLVNVALLDSAGNLHNPPITQSISVNYQTPTSGYQSDSGNYQSSGGDYQSSGSGWSINPATYQNSMTMTAFVSIDGSSKGSGSLAAFAGSQIRGLQSNLSFPTFGPHQGQGLFQIMIYGEIDSTPLQFKWSADGTEANAISVSRQDGISISFENNGNQGSVISPVSLLGTSQPNNSYQTPSSGYQTPSGGNQSPGGGYQTPSGGYQTPSGGNQSPSGGYQTPSGGYQTPSSGYQTPTSGYQSDSGNYQSSGGDYQSSGSGWSINPATYQNSMTMTALVSIDGSSKGSGSLAAFAGSQIRGLQSNLSFPTFGPHQGQGLFQIMIYGEIDSTPLQFKWSTDGTETNAISVSRQDGISISFENNGNQGSVISPVSLLGTSQPNNSYQSDSGNYQSSGGDYQSDSDGYQSPDSDYQDPTGEQAEENTPFTVTASKLTNGQITFTSNAPVDSLYSVEIQLTNLSNLSPSKEGKLIFNLDGKGSTTLMTLDQVEEDGGWGYNWSYWWNYGYSGESQNFNYAYRIPYTSEEKFMVGQGYMGTWSHQDTYAIDWSMPEGTTLYAARAGKVIMVKEDSNEGGSEKSFIDKANYVTIGHLDGSKADYLHLQQNGALVKVGDIVKIGDPIGLSGNTGWSTEPHLHFQVFHQTDPRNSTTVATSFLDKDGNIISMQEGNSYYGSGDLIESTPNIIAPLPNIEDQAPITDDQSLGGTDEPTAVLPVFVTTIGFQSNVNEVILSGEILHKSESDYTNIKVGFLISPSAEIMEIDPLTYKVSGFFESAGLFSANYTPSSNGVLYFKAFAENESGVSYGNIRKISNNEISNTQNQTPTEKAISILQVDSIEVSGGWKQNSWFGLYKDYSNGWVYHNELGWLYLSADTTNGIWAWSEERSWVWSSKEVYPFLYQSNVGDWIYFLTSNDGQLYFYNYFTDSVEVNSP